jgi:hypothetical protein
MTEERTNPGPESYTPTEALKMLVIPVCHDLTMFYEHDMGSDDVQALMLTIMLQESRLMYRRQLEGGPARGLAQFEQGGGTAGVLNHERSYAASRMICEKVNIDPVASIVQVELEFNDYLAVAFARLLLWTDLAPIPAIYDYEETWECYMRVWRPGKPHPDTWDAFVNDGADAVLGDALLA